MFSKISKFKMKLGYLLLGFFIFFPLLAKAEQVFDPARPPQELEYLVPWIFMYVLIVSGFILVVVLIIAGFKHLTAVGDPGKISDAKDQLNKGVLGILLLIASFGILFVINPELVVPGLVLKEEQEQEIIPRKAGVHLCYQIKNEHFLRQDFNFKCDSISYRGTTPPEHIETRDDYRYGKVQKYRVWTCRDPQIKHQGQWIRICNNLAEQWAQMLDFDAYLYPLKDPDDPDIEPNIIITDTLSYHYNNVQHCKDIFDKECIKLTDSENKCYVIDSIKIFTPKYQCYRFRTDSEVGQEDLKSFDYYRIVEEKDDPQVDFGIIFHEEIDFKGRCFFYQSENNRGKVHSISNLQFSEYDAIPNDNVPAIPATNIKGNFHSISIFRIVKTRFTLADRPALTLFERIEFEGNYEKIDLFEVTVGPEREDYKKVRKANIPDKLKNNVRSLKIERGVLDNPMIAVLFSGIHQTGFCEVFTDCDPNLEDTEIGKKITIDPGDRLPIRFPWLFFSSTAESVIFISGERI